VIVSETGRDNFVAPFLKHLAGGIDYSWFCLPPHGRSGGILVGVNNESLVDRNVVAADFCVKLHIMRKK
jgi:hypothetical protein